MDINTVSNASAGSAQAASAKTSESSADQLRAAQARAAQIKADEDKKAAQAVRADNESSERALDSETSEGRRDKVDIVA